MPQVPVVSGNSVGLTPRPIAAVQPTQLSDAIGQGLQHFGVELGDFAQAQSQIADMKGRADAVAADNQYAAYGESLLSDPKTGLLVQGGRNALDGYEPFVKSLQDKRAEIQSSLSPIAQKYFSTAADQRINALQTAASRHVAIEFGKYQDQTSAAKIDQSASDAAKSYDNLDLSEKSLAAGITEIAARGHLPANGWSDETIQQKQRAWLSDQRKTIAATLTDASADAGQAYLDRFKSDFDGSDVLAISKAIEVKRAKDLVLADHQNNLVKQQAREALSTLNARIDNGEQVPDDDLKKGEQLAAAIGDDSGAYKLGVTRQRVAINDESQGWLPQQYNSRISALLAKGKDRSPQEDIELNQLQKIAPQRITELRNDPAKWGAMNGSPAPAIDWSDPNTLAQRAQWTRTMTQATGIPTPFLTGDERQTLATQAGASPAARIQVIDQLAAIGSVSRQDAVRTARMVLPNDDLAAHLVLLNPGNRAAAFRGAEARKANKDIIDKETLTGGGDGPARQAAQNYQTNVAPALALMSQTDAKSVYDLASNMYADWAVHNGKTADADFSEGQFSTFMQIALGAQKDQNGVFHGGVGYVHNQPVLLPSDMSSDQFNTHFARLSWAERSAKAPVWANGQAMRPKDIRDFTPVARPDGSYEFHKDGTVLRNRDGGVWTVRFSNAGITQ